MLSFGYSIRLSISLVSSFVFISPAFAQILADPTFDRAVELYRKGDVKTALPMLQKEHRENPTDSAVAYLYAACLHRAGRLTEAVAEYENILNHFPNSDATRMSEAALRVLAPDFLAHWKSKKLASAAFMPIHQGSSVGPDMGTNNGYTVDRDRWPFEKRGTAMVIDCVIAGAAMRAVLDPSADHSTLGRNVMKALDIPAVNYGIKDENPIMKTNVHVGTLHRYAFPVHLVSYTAMPVLGRDFLVSYNYAVDKKNNTFVIARRKGATENEMSDRGGSMYSISGPYSTSVAAIPKDSAGQPVAPAAWTEIPITRVGDMFIANVSIDGSTVAMQVNSNSGGCTFSADQLNAINPSYLNDVNANTNTTLTGNIVTYQTLVTLKNVRIGPVTCEKLAATVIDQSTARFQAYKFVTSQYPVLGMDVWGPWEHQIDEKKLVLKVRRRS